MDLDFPYHVDATGRTALADADRHIRGLIEQALFTAPGERVNRPEFGAGLSQLVFAPNSDELAATLQLLVRGSLQQWLSDRIRVDDVTVEYRDSTLEVSVRFTALPSQESATARFSREV
jgi:phage baseplate assembly protein W